MLYLCALPVSLYWLHRAGVTVRYRYSTATCSRGISLLCACAATDRSRVIGMTITKAHHRPRHDTDTPDERSTGTLHFSLGIPIYLLRSTYSKTDIMNISSHFENPMIMLGLLVVGTLTNLWAQSMSSLQQPILLPHGGCQGHFLTEQF